MRRCLKLKRIIATGLCLVLILSFVGCGNTPKPGSGDQSKPYGASMPSGNEAIDTETPQAATTENNGVSQETDILEKPPVLTVVCGENSSVEALMGTYSWTYLNDKGTGMGINADSIHPLEAKKYMPYFANPDPSTVNLQWGTMPDMISVRCWNEKDWGQPDAESTELEVRTLMVDSNVDMAPVPTIQLKDGNHIYEVIAVWNSSEKYNGTVCYSFYTVQ